jgi:hypothetical protein
VVITSESENSPFQSHPIYDQSLPKTPLFQPNSINFPYLSPYDARLHMGPAKLLTI